MKSTIRRRLDMAQRALQMATAHPVPDSGFVTILASLRTNVDAADTLAVLEVAGHDQQHAAVTRADELRRSLRSLQMSRLCRIAKRGAMQHPELKGRFTMPRKSAPDPDFFHKARGLLDDALAHRELLETIGLGDTLIEEFTDAFTSLEQAGHQADAARADHLGARAELLATTNRCTADVGVLDTYMRAFYTNDVQVLAAWKSARNIDGPLRRPVVPRATPDPGPDTPPS